MAARRRAQWQLRGVDFKALHHLTDTALTQAGRMEAQGEGDRRQ